jgi:hypothetical protein
MKAAGVITINTTINPALKLKAIVKNVSASINERASNNMCITYPSLCRRQYQSTCLENCCLLKQFYAFGQGLTGWRVLRLCGNAHWRISGDHQRLPPKKGRNLKNVSGQVPRVVKPRVFERWRLQ